MSEKWKNSCRRDARAAIAAIRPHIEAAERDALAARLAPVDDEALVEIATREIFIERRSLAAAIAAIRPHIEAAERERCAKEIDEYRRRYGDEYRRRYGGNWTALIALAATIRSGK